MIFPCATAPQTCPGDLPAAGLSIELVPDPSIPDPTYLAMAHTPQDPVPLGATIPGDDSTTASQSVASQLEANQWAQIGAAQKFWDQVQSPQPSTYQFVQSKQNAPQTADSVNALWAALQAAQAAEPSNVEALLALLRTLQAQVSADIGYLYTLSTLPNGSYSVSTIDYILAELEQLQCATLDAMGYFGCLLGGSNSATTQAAYAVWQEWQCGVETPAVAATPNAPGSAAVPVTTGYFGSAYKTGSCGTTLTAYQIWNALQNASETALDAVNYLRSFPRVAQDIQTTANLAIAFNVPEGGVMTFILSVATALQEAATAIPQTVTFLQGMVLTVQAALPDSTNYLLNRTGAPAQGQPWTPPKPLKTYTNDAQSCAASCPSPFDLNLVTVPAGLFKALTKDTANAQAKAAACAALPFICLPDIPGVCCAGVPYTDQFGNPVSIKASLAAYSAPITTPDEQQAYAAAQNIQYSITGNPPPGLSITVVNPTLASPGYLLTGTPTTGGSFTFTVQALRTLTNQIHRRTYTIRILQITPSVLPPAVSKSLYSAQLTLTTIPPGAASWYVTNSANWPNGFSLTGQGVIFSTGFKSDGTPVTPGTYAFQVTANAIISGQLYVCNQLLGLIISAPSSAVNWPAMIWDLVQASYPGTQGDGYANGTASGAQASWNLSGATDGSSDAVFNVHGSLLYTGSGANCNITFPTFSVNGPPDYYFGVQVLQDGVPLQLIGYAPFKISFTVGPGTNSLIEVRGQSGGFTNLLAWASAGSGPPLNVPAVSFAGTMVLNN